MNIKLWSCKKRLKVKKKCVCETRQNEQRKVRYIGKFVSVIVNEIQGMIYSSFPSHSSDIKKQNVGTYRTFLLDFQT